MIAGSPNDPLPESLQRGALAYFMRDYNPGSGLVHDKTGVDAPCSIAVIGLALSVYPVGVERDWMDRADAVQRKLATLRFLMVAVLTVAAYFSSWRTIEAHKCKAVMTAEPHTVSRLQLGSVAPKYLTRDSMISSAMMNQLEWSPVSAPNNLPRVILGFIRSSAGVSHLHPAPLQSRGISAPALKCTR